MCKKTSFRLLLIFLVLNLVAFIPTKLQSEDLSTTFSCELPAPNNFQVTSRMEASASLVWSEVENADSYFLEVFIKSTNNEWSQYLSYDGITASSLTIENLSSELECKFILGANCIAGGKSVHVVELMDKIILDLVVAGRRPAQPRAMNCSEIPMNQLEWIGFQVSRISGGPSDFNQFEVRIPPPVNGSQHIEIYKVFNASTIYAVNHNLVYPPPRVQHSLPGWIGKSNQFGIIQEFGKISFEIDYWNDFISFCPFDWDPDYTFTAIVADNVIQNNQNTPQGISASHTDLVSQATDSSSTDTELLDLL